MEWNRETTLHFISLIKARPAIWDFQSPEHKVKRKRLEAVEEVALLMGVPPKEVSTKWIILRNQYSRERRKIIESGEDAPYVTKWYAYKDMDGLMTRNKKPITNFWNQESKSGGDDSSNSPPATPNRPSVSGEQKQAVDLITQNSLSLFNQAIKTLKSIRENQKVHNDDELTNYGLYIAAHIRKFRPPLQSRAKYEINKILYSLDLESMGEYSATIPVVDEQDIATGKECKYDPLQNNKE